MREKSGVSRWLSESRVAVLSASLLLAAATCLAILFEWTADTTTARLASAATVLAIAILWFQIDWSRRAFVLVALGVFLAGVVTLPDWRAAAEAGLRSSIFIVAFFTSLITLRSVAAGSTAIMRCGHFLAHQPPGRRYLALSAGGHLFGLILSYGAITLLGGMATAKRPEDDEASEEVRNHRRRRMLVAIQRGFVSSLPWSPFAFAIAISTSLIPGASWGAVVGWCAVSSLLLMALGWTLDTIFKPRLSAPAPVRTAPEGTWLGNLAPLLVLLGVLVVGVAGLYSITQLRIVAIVMTVVPLIALGWIAFQRKGDGPGPARRIQALATGFINDDIPRFRAEVVLLSMAGFIGTMGSHLAEPLVLASGVDLTAVPGWVILMGLFWLIPVVGQFGMNPILAVSLTVPLLPSPEALGLSPSILVLAITSGWAISGATSPFTASTLLTGALGNVSATHVGLRWNGLYAITCGVVLSGWVLLVAQLI
ncbi:hypothetical protein [Alkalilacustris brevis]|uniref:hypothetical protein n=1 Tax=Alkalilacustris brevis TaxID=2026338 RepID=UPI001EE4124E|nr:hypothetical protein [Alkalilacustris brevis]